MNKEFIIEENIWTKNTRSNSIMVSQISDRMKEVLPDASLVSNRAQDGNMSRSNGLLPDLATINFNTDIRGGASSTGDARGDIENSDEMGDFHSDCGDCTSPCCITAYTIVFTIIVVMALRPMIVICVILTGCKL